MAFFEIKWKPSTTELRKFGLGSAAILALLGACVFWREHLLGMDFSSKTAGLVGGWLWGVAGACLVTGLAWPGALKPLYLILTAIGLPIGFAVSYIILAGIFFLIFLPIGLVFRLIGRDALHRKFDPQAQSYWSNYDGHPPTKRYFRQF